MPADWRKELMETYPHLFSRPIDERRVTAGYPGVEDGWRDIVETAASRIAAALGSRFEALSISQIKEKFGQIRIYFNRTDLPSDVWARIREAVTLAEARSACTCETCGAAGRLYEDRGSYSTRCDAHAVGFVPAHPSGREYLDFKCVLENGTTRWACRRYERDRDEFIEVPLPPDFDPDAEG
jgi:hypothetical protein